MLLSSKSHDWYTPPQYIEAARRVMGGGIDLDPASTEAANATVRAVRFYSEADNGLALPWSGRIWLNSPYGKTGATSNQELWTGKLICEYRAGNVSQAITLVNFVPGYKWWGPLWQFPICSVDHCIRFQRSDGQPAGLAKASSAFVYLGPREGEARFKLEFRRFGPVVRFDPHTGTLPTCPICGQAFAPKQGGGSQREYCSAGCKQRAYRSRLNVTL